MEKTAFSDEDLRINVRFRIGFEHGNKLKCLMVLYFECT